MDFIHKYILSHASFSAPNGIVSIPQQISFEGPAIIVIPLEIFLFGSFSWSLIWVYRDASKRNRNPIFAIIFLLVAGWPFSLLFWNWLRPEIKSQSNEIKNALSRHFP